MSDTYFTKDHEWIKIENNIGIVGITKYASEQLGDIVFVELPEKGSQAEKGKDVAVVTDAGTPGVSDPAYKLIRSVIQVDVKVEPIPGASAFLTALVASGLPTDRFLFVGFLPPKKGRRKKLKERSVVCFRCTLRCAVSLHKGSTIDEALKLYKISSSNTSAHSDVEGDSQCLVTMQSRKVI